MGYIFLSSYCSLLESQVMDIPLTTDLNKADYIVNSGYLLNNDKTLILDLTFDFNITELIDRYPECNIISRFSIGVDNYTLDEYKITNSAVQNPSTNIILNKYMMNNLNDLNFVNSNNFLLGIDSELDGKLTAVGYKLLN